MPAAASNPTVAVAGLTTKALSAIVDASAAVADEYTPITDDTITNAPIIIDTNAHIDDKHAVIADVDGVPAANNNLTTTPYNNLMSAARCDSLQAGLLSLPM